jgi:hypothetical protein
MKNQELWIKIQNSPLVLAGDDNLIDRVIKETNWSKSKVKDVILAYKKFLYLAAINKEVVPSKEVDVVWHHHILFTNDYFVRWSNILGKTVHHSPEIKGVKNTYNSIYKETYNSYVNEFGKNDDSLLYFILLNNVIETNNNHYYKDKNHSSHSCSSNSINIEESHKTPHQPWSDYPSTPKQHHSDSISNYHNHHWDNYSATHDSPSTHHSCSSHNDSSSSDSGSSSSCSSSSCGSSCGGGGD